MYFPSVEPETPATSTTHGFRWNFTRKNTMSVQAGGAITGMRSTANAQRKTARYIQIADKLSIQCGGGKRVKPPPAALSERRQAGREPPEPHAGQPPRVI